MKELQKNTQYCIKNTRGIAQSGLQSNLVDWIVIDHPNSKSDFGFGLSIQFCCFNPNPKYQNYFIKKLKFHTKNSWIWIRLSIHFENWIWIVNHIFVMDFGWIDNLLLLIIK